MRHRLAIVLLCSIAAGPGCGGKPAPQAADPATSRAPAAVAADPPLSRTTETLADDKPIPQDLAAMEKRRRERLEWNRRTLVEAYDRVGKKDPKWDAKAREAMELAARMFSQVVDPKVSLADVHAPAKAAVAAGCDDPLLVYLFNRTAYREDYPGQEETIRRMKASARSIAASRYPAVRRAAVLEKAGVYGLDIKEPTEEIRAEAEANFDASLALLKESVKNDERGETWETNWFNTVVSVIQGYRNLGMAAPDAYKRADDRLAEVPEIEAFRLLCRGNFWLHYGWEARTQAFAPNVPAGGFESLEERLAEARRALEASWKLRPDAEVAGCLLEIDKAVGGDRATMEMWFERSMNADGDRRDTCWSKLDWLDAKWHGTEEEMLAFGRRCRDTKNWRVGITLLCADAHSRAASVRPPEERAKYWGRPEVWADVKSVYDEYLKHHPDDDTARSKYALFCFFSNHLAESRAQFEAVGERLVQWREFPYVPLADMKRIRDHIVHAVVKPAKKATAKP